MNAEKYKRVKLTDAFRKAFADFNFKSVKAMQKEIESVVRTMAESLSGIAQKFVDDYAPLLEQTRQIVEMGKKAKN